MQVYGPMYVHGPQSISAPHQARPQAAAQAAPAGGDRLEISEAGRLMDLLSQTPEIRHDRVAALRAAIAEGKYETEARLDLAVSRLLDEIG